MNKILDFLASFWVGIWLNLHRRHATCQCISDSGKPRETACDVIHKFRDPGSVRFVCPALRQYPEGWRCRIHRQHIKPSWRQPLQFLGVLLFSAVIATTGLVYGHYRYNHIPVRYADIVLPWRWSHVTEAKARNYVEQYNRYMGVGQWGRAAQALSLAYQIHPNTDYGVRLAQMWALLAEYTWSDQVYASLIRDHPEQRDALIYDWTRMLIARRADFQLRRLAEQELAAHPEHFAWTRYYIDLLRQNSDALREAQVKATPLHWLLQAELQIGRASCRERV